jgi:hypothetical protein
VTVLVEGIEEADIVSEIERTVQVLFHEARIAGSWIVAVAPSETRGRWDVGLKGPSGRHIFSFAGASRDVPVLIAEHLRRAIKRAPH